MYKLQKYLDDEFKLITRTKRAYRCDSDVSTYFNGDIRLFVTALHFPHETLSGRVIIERDDCFDKITNCPVSLPYPRDEEEFHILKAAVMFLSSDEGYDFSNKLEGRLQSYKEAYEFLTQSQFWIDLSWETEAAQVTK